MATTKSRARMLVSYARHGIEDAIQLDNCKTMILRIEWDLLREENYDLYEQACQAVQTLGLTDTLARVHVRF